MVTEPQGVFQTVIITNVELEQFLYAKKLLFVPTRDFWSRLEITNATEFRHSPQADAASTVTLRCVSHPSQPARALPSLGPVMHWNPHAQMHGNSSSRQRSRLRLLPSQRAWNALVWPLVTADIFNREMHPLAQRALREEVKGAALARGLRKIVDLFQSFSPTASILGSLSLRALTDQSPADETVVTAARGQAKASASKVAIAAAVRALPWVQGDSQKRHNFATIGIGIDPARTPLLLPTVPSTLGGGSIRSGRV